MNNKDAIIIEFITKFQGLAYNKLGVCCLCGGGRKFSDNTFWKPQHDPECLFSRAEKEVYGNVTEQKEGCNEC